MGENKCKKCGTFDKVNFEGMCEKCYIESIGANNKSTYEDDEETDNLKSILKIKWDKLNDFVLNSFSKAKLKETIKSIIIMILIFILFLFINNSQYYDTLYKIKIYYLKQKN